MQAADYSLSRSDASVATVARDAAWGLFLGLAAYGLCCLIRFVLLRWVAQDAGASTIRPEDVWLAGFLVAGEVLGALACGGPMARLSRRGALALCIACMIASACILMLRDTPQSGPIPMVMGTALLTLGLVATAAIGAMFWPRAAIRSRRRRAAIILALWALAVTAVADGIRPFPAQNVYLSLIAVSPGLAMLGLGSVPPSRGQSIHAAVSTAVAGSRNGLPPAPPPAPPPDGPTTPVSAGASGHYTDA